MNRLIMTVVLGGGTLLVGCQKGQQPEDQASAREDYEEQVAQEEDFEDEEPFAQDEAVIVMPVAVIVATPTEWSGKEVEGTAQVSEVPSERGFWLEENGNRLFAILRTDPGEDQVQIQQGQTLQIEQASVRTPQDLAQIEGDPLDQQTIEIVQQEPVFLVVDRDDISIVSGPGS